MCEMSNIHRKSTKFSLGVMAGLVSLVVVASMAWAASDSTYIKGPALLESSDSIATSGATTELTAASPTKQQFTGTTTQTVKLPDATTLKNGRKFLIMNRSTQAVSVVDGSGGALRTLPGDTRSEFTLMSNASVSGTWDSDNAYGVTAPGTPDHVVINDGSGKLSSEEHLSKTRGGSGQDNSSLTFPATGTLATQAGTEQLTNKDIDGGTASDTSRITLPKASSATLSGLTRKQGTIAFDTDQSKPVYDDGSNLLPIGSGSGSGGENLLSNGDFETGTASWTTGTGVTAAENTSDFVQGKKSVTLTLSSANGTLFEQCVTPAQNVANLNMEAALKVKTAVTGLKLCSVLDSVEQQCVDVKATDQWYSDPYTPTYIGAAASQCVSLKSTSAVSGSVIVDDGYLGLNRGLMQVSQAKFVGSIKWSGCADVFAGASGSGAVGNAFSNFTAQTGCTYTTTGDVLAPSTMIPGFKLSGDAGVYRLVFVGGIGATADSSGNVFAAVRFSDGTDSTQEVYYSTTKDANIDHAGFEGSITKSSAFSNLTFQIQNRVWGGNAVNSYVRASGGNANSGTIYVYRFPTQAEQAVRADTSAQNWAGNATGFTGISNSASYADQSTSLTGSIVALSGNSGIPCVQASGQLGVTCTLPTVGLYNVDYSGYAELASGSTGWIKITDGSNSTVIEEQSFTTGGTGYRSATGGRAKYYNSVAGAVVTFKVRGKNNGSVNMTYYLSNFSIESATQPRPAPLLVGSVISGSSGLERVERARVAASCTSSPCTIASQSSAWLSSITRSAAGTYRANFASGIFSSTPSCIIYGSNNSNIIAFAGSLATSTQFDFVSGNVGSLAGTDAGFDIICMGPR